jgi:hypothetical protein
MLMTAFLSKMILKLTGFQKFHHTNIFTLRSLTDPTLVHGTPDIISFNRSEGTSFINTYAGLRAVTSARQDQHTSYQSCHADVRKIIDTVPPLGNARHRRKSRQDAPWAQKQVPGVRYVPAVPSWPRDGVPACFLLRSVTTVSLGSCLGECTQM